MTAVIAVGAPGNGQNIHICVFTVKGMGQEFRKAGVIISRNRIKRSFRP